LDDLEPIHPPARERLRRLGRGAYRPVAALLFPSRGVPPLVTAGRYQVALVVVLGAALLSAFAVGSRLDMGPAIRAMNAEAPRGPGGGGEMPAPELKTDREIAEEIDKATAVTRVKLGLDAGLMTPLAIFFLGLGLFLLGRYVGGSPSVSRSMAAAAVGSLPLAVRSLIEAAAAFRQESVLPQHLGKLVEAGWPFDLQHPLAVRLLTGIDLFTLWSFVLLGFGLAAAASIRRRRAFIALAVATIVYLLITQVILGGPPPGAGPS
jgi:hypothetical protein